MIAALLTLQFVAAIIAAPLVRKYGRNTLLGLAAVPGLSVLYAALNSGVAMHSPPVEIYPWVPTLQLDLVFQLDVLSWWLLLIVGGVGALVLIYSARYFRASASGLPRFAAYFLGFSGAMQGVVLADHTMTLYVFWELTAIFSYLLIGFHTARAPARSAARQALLVTGFGGLAMFAGLVMVSMKAGSSFRISLLVEAIAAGQVDVASPQMIVGALLILLGGMAKSAQVPFHFWLPGAMAAPTPVSAYLHAAAMVKAGVVLVARFAPGFAYVPYWSATAVTVGLFTMVLGAYRALRQRDLKLVLAYGTVSQLGLLVAAAGYGTQEALAAALVLLLAHSLFKSALFLTVGAIETATGTRDLWELSNLKKQLPWLAGFAGVAALSMAGVPVTVGYLGKEGFLAAMMHGAVPPWLAAAQPVNGIILAVASMGSMMTAAYAWRFWWGAFGSKDGVRGRTAKQLSGYMTGPVYLLAGGAVLGVFAGAMNRVLGQPAEFLPGQPHVALWSGIAPALLTAAILAGGAVLAYLRPAVARAQKAMETPLSAARVYSWMLRELELGASRLTGLTQRGSLPQEAGTIFAVMSIAAVVGIAKADKPAGLPHLWDRPLQAGIAIVGMLAVVITVTARRRIKAALALGAVGMTISALFAIHGAPDLALTQLAVEAVSVVVFILVLRKLPIYFSARPLKSTRITKAIIAIAAGTVTAVGGYYAVSSRMHEPVSNLMPREALDFGFGHNIVNVILVDIRAWDTMGEITVLLVTATGVASLIYVMSRVGRIDRVAQREKAGFLRGVIALDPVNRSMVLEVSTRLLFPTMMVLSVWLLMVGHDNPGGGFAGGVVAGLAFVLRYLAGGRYELGESMPIPAGILLGGGLFLAAFGGALPLLSGRAPFQSVPVDVALGPIGNLHFTTAMILDVGVYVLVIGLIIDLVSALGAEIDRQSDLVAVRPHRQTSAREARARETVGGTK